MAYEMVMPYHLHMPSYFLETFTEYPYVHAGPHTKNLWFFSEFILKYSGTVGKGSVRNSEIIGSALQHLF